MLGIGFADPGPFVEPVGDATRVYANARLALREGRPVEATKLWLLRNAVESSTGRISAHDADFRTVTWAALGQLGLCQDGMRPDEEGGGLWPLAMHNQVVASRSVRPRKRPRPYDAFELGRQHRFVSIGDVLDLQELRTVNFSRGPCLEPRLLLPAVGASPTADLKDRAVATRLLRLLLDRGAQTLVQERVRGVEVIAARRFDLLLEETAIAAREARQETRDRARGARAAGMSRQSVIAIVEDAPTHLIADGSEAAGILADAAGWDADAWMALSPERRVFLYDHARSRAAGSVDCPALHPPRPSDGRSWGPRGCNAAFDAIALGVVDRLLADQQGIEVDRWIARVGPDARTAVWSGERGRRLLDLDRVSGFTERAVVAVHRGVALLETGDLDGALRAFAFALEHAPDSRAAEALQGLALRWVSYVASRFEVTDGLLVTLKQILPRREYGVLREDLAWAAAFRADAASFARARENPGGQGALERRVELLAPLAAGDVDGFIAKLRPRMQDSPSETLRFLDQLVQRLELEDADVRAAQLPMLRGVRSLLEPLAASGGSVERVATGLLGRTQAIVEGLGGLGDDASTEDRARSLGPDGEVYAGSVRLAPSDALPWPFKASEVPAPSVFEPIRLVPVEWRDDQGSWVFGWQLGG